MSQDLVILDKEDKHVTFADCVEIIEQDNQLRNPEVYSAMWNLNNEDDIVERSGADEDCKETTEDELHEVQEEIDDVKEELTMNYIEKKILKQRHEELMKRLDRILKDMGII